MSVRLVMSDQQSANHGRSKQLRLAAHAATRAFTLIELMVVVAIIILLVGIAVPAVGPALNTSQQAQAIQQLTGAITIAQARAMSQGGYALRVERAFKTNIAGFMVDANGEPCLAYDKNGELVSNSAFDPSAAPVWLDYQQIRYVRPSRVNPCYEPTIDDVIKLPPSVWLAPDYATSTGFDVNYYNSSKTGLWSSTTPPRSSQRFNPFETFCIVFDQSGQVTELRAYNLVQSDKYQYQDQTQPRLISNVVVPPITWYPYNSARGVIVYDRKQFESLGSDTAAKTSFLRQKGRPIFVNRFLGSLVEGRTP